MKRSHLRRQEQADALPLLEEFRGKTSLQGSGHAQEARTLALEQEVKRIPHEVQQVPQGTEGRCCSNSSLREKLLKLFNLVIEKARAPSPSFFFSIPEDYCHCYIIPNLKKVVKGWASL